MSAVPILRDPNLDTLYTVGDVVEVNCDFEKGGERQHGWIRGIVVQVDSKMVAVQFRANVYLTDGWMVPDHILWYPLHSPAVHIYVQKHRHPASEDSETPSPEEDR